MLNPKIDFGTNKNPVSIAVADINGDGKLDMVVANSVNGFGSFSVYKNTSTNTTISFAPKVDFGVYTIQNKIAVADFNFDGLPDIAVLAQYSVGIFKNIGNVNTINFEYASAGISANGIIADFVITELIEPQNKVDIAIINSNANTISIFQNACTNSGFYFNSYINDYATAQNPKSISFANLNYINRSNDLIVSNFGSNSISCYKNEGSTFTPKNDRPTGNRPSMLVAANLTGNEFYDIITLSQTNSSITILQNDSSVFPNYIDIPNRGFLTRASYSTSSSPSAIVIADLNADGKADIVTASSTSNVISIHRNTIHENVPVINTFSPSNASAGQIVTIKGKYFTNTSSIRFGGTLGTYTIVNDSTITAQSGLGASGNIKLYNTNGFGKKSGFVFKTQTPLQIINTIAGNDSLGYSGDGGNSLNSTLNRVYSTCYDTARNWLYIGDVYNYRIRKIDLSTGIISTIAGNGIGGYSINGDGGPATAVQLTAGINGGLVVDKYGNLFFSERGSGGKIRKIDINTGIITSIAGGGYDTEGNGIPASSADLSFPTNITIDRDDNLYIGISDKIRKIDLSTGLIYTIAGNANGIESDSILAINAYLNPVGGLTIDKNKNIYFTENKGFIPNFPVGKIRKLNTTTGVLTTLAGKFIMDAQMDGDGGLGLNAQLGYSFSITLDTSGKQLYFNQSNGSSQSIPTTKNRIRKLDLNSGIITAVAGANFFGYSGDGGDALNAELLEPVGLSIDKKNRIYFSDGRRYIRRISLANNDLKLCPGGSTSITTDIIGTSYQWQLALSDTSTFTNIIDNAQLSGSTTATLSLNNIPSSWYGYKFRCVINGTNDRSYLLKFENVWTGAVSTAWENAANWSCGSVPDANTDVVINAGNVVISSNVTIRTLRVMPGATVTVNSGYTLTITH